nr:atherin-like [Cavia porcellus]
MDINSNIIIIIIIIIITNDSKNSGWLSPAATAAAPCAASSPSSALPAFPSLYRPALLRAPPASPTRGRALQLPPLALLAARAPLPASPPAASPPWCLPAWLGRPRRPISARSSSAPQWLGTDARRGTRAGRPELQEASDARPTASGPGSFSGSPCPPVNLGLRPWPRRASSEKRPASCAWNSCRHDRAEETRVAAAASAAGGSVRRAPRCSEGGLQCNRVKDSISLEPPLNVLKTLHPGQYSSTLTCLSPCSGTSLPNSCLHLRLGTNINTCQKQRLLCH